MRLAFLLSFALLFCTPALADWNAQSLLWAQEFAEGPVLFPDPHVIEAWSEVQDQSDRDAHLKIESVPSAKMGSGKFAVALQKKRTKSLSILKAPLILLLPGLYDEKDSHGPMRTAASFSARGYHIVMPSNPWSDDFIKDKPKFNPGDLEQEAEIGLEALDYAITQIGTANITQVSIAGESYGAMLAAIAFAMDQARAKPRIDGIATLISPPLDMQGAINNLDNGIDATQQEWQHSCSSPGDLLTDYNSLSCHSTQAAMSPEVVRCAGAIVFNSFQSGLVHSMMTLHSVKGSGTIPTEAKAHQAWKESLRFKDIIPDFTPENAHIITEGKGKLSFWIGSLSTNSLARLQIISAVDDLLNQELSWNLDGQGPFTSSNVILLPWGGHTGYENLHEFQGLLDDAFRVFELTRPEAL